MQKHGTATALSLLGTSKAPNKRSEAPLSDGESKPKTKSARRREALKRKLSGQGSSVPPPPAPVPGAPSRKGRGKGSREGRQFPSELKGMMSRMPNGKRICWDFNCLAGCANGDDCPPMVPTCACGQSVSSRVRSISTQPDKHRCRPYAQVPVLLSWTERRLGWQRALCMN